MYVMYGRGSAHIPTNIFHKTAAKMKVLALSRYSRLGASSRLRTMQYIPSLTAAGIDVQVSAFFDDAYLLKLYAGQKNQKDMPRYFFWRVRELLTDYSAELIWVEKEALPWIPWVLERALLPHKVPLVCDIDDAVFHRYDVHPRKLVRTVLGKKIDRVFQASSLVTAGNEYLATRARAAGAQRVEIVPTVVDTDAYQVNDQIAADGKLRVGWIGTPQTWKELAQPVYSTVLPELRRNDALFCAVGASLTIERHDALEILPWSEDTEIASIQSMDIGVMPLPDSPWTRGKCGYKLIQYMACGVPVIAAPVGINATIVEHGINGFLAESEAEWQSATNRLLSDPELRQRMGRAGRRKVEENFALESWGKKLAGMLLETAGKKTKNGYSD